MLAAMDAHRVVLRLSLGCLAVTAASASALLFLPWSGGAGRFTLSALAATFIAGLSIPFAGWIEKPEARWAGFVGLAFLCSELVLVIAALWFSYFAPTMNGIEIVSAMVYLLAVAPFAILGARQIERRPLVAWTTLIPTGIALALLLVQAFAFEGFETFDSSRRPLGWISFALLLCGGAAAMGLVAPRVPEVSARAWLRRWPLLATLLAITAAILATVFFVELMSNARWGVGPPLAFTTGLSVLGFAYAIGLSNVLLLPRLRGVAAGVPWATAGASLLAAALLAAMVLALEESLATPLIASLLLVVSGSLGVLVLSRFAAAPVFVTDRSIVQELDVRCPRCSDQQALPFGKSACRRCGLRFRIDVEEPRCRECSHLLVGTQSDHCPECGTPIALPAHPPVIANP